VVQDRAPGAVMGELLQRQGSPGDIPSGALIVVRREAGEAVSEYTLRGAAVYPDPVSLAGGRVRGTTLLDGWLLTEVQSGRYAFELSV
jgi:hypothetical protein